MNSRLLDRPIAFHPIFAKLTGSVTAALMLSQGIYWANRTQDANGWFYKSQAEWEEETAMSRREQETARRILRELGFWIEDLKGVPARLFYRVDFDGLDIALDSFQESCQTSMAESAKLVWRKAPNWHGGKRQSFIQETTTETTTENKTTNVVGADTFAKPKASRSRVGLLQGEELENWLIELQNDFAYASIAVRMEYAKMLRWCEANKRQPTKRRFISWLNRIDTVSQPAQTKQETPQEREARLKALWEGKRAA